MTAGMPPRVLESALSAAYNPGMTHRGGLLALAVLAASCFSPTGSTATSDSTSSTGAAASSSDVVTSAEASSTEDVSTSAVETSTGLASSSSAGSSSTSNTSRGACGDGQLDEAEECDDGAQVSGDGCSSSCIKEFRRVFVTSQVFTGDLGGVEGADEKCQSAAEAAGLPGEYRAWLSTPVASPADWPVHSTVPYRQINGVDVAGDWEQLLVGPLTNGIYVSEWGGDAGVGMHSCIPDSRPVWTNTQTDATSYTSDMHCGNWGSTTGEGSAGQAGAKNFSWTVGCLIKCGEEAALYCFEQ